MSNVYSIKRVENKSTATADPTSEVMKVAKRISGEHEIEFEDREPTERDILNAIVRDLTDTALAFYTYASEARTTGNVARCTKLTTEAVNAMNGARDALALISALDA